MKSAYELAMERLEKNNPKETAISDADKAKLAEIDTLFRSRIAEREVFLGGLLAQAKANRSYTEIVELEEQLSREVRKMRDQCEGEKEKVRTQKK